MKKQTKEEFIAKAIEKHGKKYDYSQSEYIDSKTKITIICPKHGEFRQLPSAHLRGDSCPLCANEKRGDTFRDSQEEFIKKAKEVHGDKYDYSKVIYSNSSTKVTIICPQHGEFQQLPSSHLSSKGCPKCSRKLNSINDFINRAKEVHENKYDYSKSIYQGTKTKITITCPVHGDFSQSPYKHLNGQGCPKCAYENKTRRQTFTKEDFLKNINKHPLDDFTHVNYVNSHTFIDIICKKHGNYKIRPYDYSNGHRCPKCGIIISKAEDEIYSYISALIGKESIIRNDRTILNGQEIDIYIPSLKLGIEYNGLRWHSEEFGKDKYYHYNKMKIANNKGINLIQIFEDEWNLRKEIVLHKLKHILQKDYDLPKIMGRKVKIIEIIKDDAEAFLNEFHIQGYGKATISLGAYYEGKLCAVMSFIRVKDKNWILTRFASDYNYTLQGVGGKMLHEFILKFNPNSIKSFADRRWSFNNNSNLYTKLGFQLTEELKPEYRYIDSKNPILRIHKFNCRKHILNKKYNFPLSMTEREMTEKLNYTKVWDCGLLKYEWNKF